VNPAALGGDLVVGVLVTPCVQQASPNSPLAAAVGQVWCMQAL
jgi:hypothetical protein